MNEGVSWRHKNNYFSLKFQLGYEWQGPLGLLLLADLKATKMCYCRDAKLYPHPPHMLAMYSSLWERGNIKDEPPRNHPIPPPYLLQEAFVKLQNFLLEGLKGSFPFEEKAREAAGAVQTARTWESLLCDLGQSGEDLRK